jgi:hypothetical protein
MAMRVNNFSLRPRECCIRKIVTVKVLFTGTDDVLDVTCRQMLACAGYARIASDKPTLRS